MRILSVGGLIVAAAVFVNATTEQTLVGKAAPKFTASGSDGKTHTLESLTNGSALVLYFIKDGCPVNSEAIKYYNAVGKAYAGNAKVKLIGVYNGDAKAFAAWNNRFKVPYPVLYDPGYKIIQAYGAQHSPWLTMVSSDRKVAKEFPGYSVKSLEDLSATMAKSGGVAKAKLSFQGAPSEDAFG